MTEKTLMTPLVRLAAALLRDRRGNVAVTVTLLMIPILFVMGMSIDYTLSRQRQDQLNGYADAAVLAAVTPAMIANDTKEQSAAAAKAMFLAQLANMPGVNYSPANITATPTETTTATSLVRKVTLAYTASSTNVFAGILGSPTLPISGSSQATSSNTPKIDFHLLIDTSPSMEIAATQADITKLAGNTTAQGGCAFACHETNPTPADVKGNPNGEDNYTFARTLGVTLRSDLVTAAVKDLLSTALSTETQNNTTYRAAIYTMDYSQATLTSSPSNIPASITDLAAAQTAAGNIAPVIVYNNNNITASNKNNDEDSNLDAGLGYVYNIMPVPGQGSANPGDTPQEVLFIVTDGMADKALSGKTCYNSGRFCGPINTTGGQDWCATIKNRGIRIAFLYLTYYPLTDASSKQQIGSVVSNGPPPVDTIAPAAQACASPGLFFQVSTNGDISAAMITLFQKAVATARLTQ
jgi:Flp pilus assembly protein TadG